MVTKSLPSNRSQRVLIALLIIVIIAVISVTELIFAYWSPSLGITLALFSALSIYLLVSMTKLGNPFADCADALVLIPVYILFTSSLPWFFIDNQLLLPAVYALILGLCFWYMQSKNISLSNIGFNKNKLIKYILIGIVIGAPAGTIEYFVLRPEPTFPVFTLKYLARDAFYMLFFVALAEEILFRGLIQIKLIPIFGLRWAIFGQAFIFMVMHLTWRSLPELGFVFAIGFLLGVIYHRTNSLTAPIVAHGVGNTMLVAVAPYLFGN